MPSSITGNKGEWSEIYVLLRLLSEGKIYAADENLKKLEHMFFPILKIIREEIKNSKYEYVPQETVKIFLNEELVSEIDASRFTAEADYLYREIVQGSNRAFPVSQTEDFMHTIGCTRLAAPSKDKTDITMQIHDIQTGYAPVCGFSIKSEIGNAPSLINAGKSTNFIYEVKGIDDATAVAINEIDTRTKIDDRMRRIFNLADSVTFFKNENKTFARNLMLIDSRMAELLSYAMLYHFRDSLGTCAEVVQKLETENPLSYPGTGLYTYKFKKFLCSAALGMTPATEWDGIDDANGGYIIVTEQGEVLAYHIYNRDFFEDYLLKQTKFERASTTRHGYASLYKQDCRTFLKLNLQVRFVK